MHTRILEEVCFTFWPGWLDVHQEQQSLVMEQMWIEDQKSSCTATGWTLHQCLLCWIRWPAYKMLPTFKEDLSVLMLCTRVNIYIQQLSSFRAPKLWFIDLAVATNLPCSIHFSGFVSICFKRKWTNHENTQSPPFSYDTKMTTNINTGAQSINTERASWSSAYT